MTVSTCKRLVILAILFAPLSACFEQPEQLPKMDATKYYERDMVVTVNGVTREGAITMPLKDVNKVHVYAQGDLDIFIMKTCGGVFKKQRAWNQQLEVRTGLFGWGTKKIDLKNEVEFEIAASDFAATGICPVYLTGISKSDGRNSEAYIAWQTDQYQLQGDVVCNMLKRNFNGVEACSIAATSFTRLTFKEDVVVSPDKGCEVGKTRGREFEWRVSPGTCNYRFESIDGKRVGIYNVYGWDSITIR